MELRDKIKSIFCGDCPGIEQGACETCFVFQEDIDNKILSLVASDLRERANSPLIIKWLLLNSVADEYEGK